MMNSAVSIATELSITSTSSCWLWAISIWRIRFTR